MGTAMMIFATLGGLVGTIVVGLLKDEATAWLPWLHQRILSLALRQVSGDQRDRYAEEWSAHVEEYPGKLSQLFQCIRILYGSAEIKLSNDEIQARRLMAVYIVLFFTATTLTVVHFISPGVQTPEQIGYYVVLMCLISSLWCMYRMARLVPWSFGKAFRRR